MDENRLAYTNAIDSLTAVDQNFELIDRTIDGVSYKLYKNAPSTLRDVYIAAATQGEREFLLYEGERWTFKALFQQAWSIAESLRAKHQIEAGHRIGIAMRNLPEWLSVFIAVTSMGAVAVPINSWGKARDLLFAARDSDCKTVFCDHQRFELMASGLAESNINAVVARATTSFGSEMAQCLESFIVGSTADAPIDSMVRTEDAAMIMYTSGTTGKPKGAVSTHRALCQALMNIECTATASAMANPTLVSQMLSKGFEPVQLLAVPLFHVSGLHAIFLAALRAGRKIVMMYKWEPEVALKLVEEERITIISAAPSMLLQLLEYKAFSQYDTSSLSSLGGGGSAIPTKVAALMREKVKGLYAGTGWGMTETNATGTAFTGQGFTENPGSAGFCQPTVEIKICDHEGRELPKGVPGRIWIKTPTLISEYWKRPEANAESFRAGWFDSGDIGYFDGNDYLYLSDRAKDVIIRGGENIYPAEIEAVLVEHPAVLEVAAYGIADEALGEQVAVAVVPRAGEVLSEDAVKHFAKEHLAGFKVPYRVAILDQPLPRNAAGKVLKHSLKESTDSPM